MWVDTLLGTSEFLISGPTAVMSILVKESLPRHFAGSTLVPNSIDPSQMLQDQHACFVLSFLAGIIQVNLITIVSIIR